MISVSPTDVSGAISRVVGRIASYGSPEGLVAFSGGVDSAVVLALSARALGVASVTAVTALSASYPAGELELARALAGSLGVRHIIIDTGEVEKEAYARNDALRCFHCKAELFTHLAGLASATGRPTVILAGANGDDAGDFRPGLLAAGRYSVRNPLMEENLSKQVVRSLARGLKLEVADKPALACLASRVAYGVRVTPDLLNRIDRAEQAVRSLGFASVRVRHFGDVAKIEVPTTDIGRLVQHARLSVLTRYLRILGWQHIALDLEGQRSGSMSASLSIGLSLRRRMSQVRVANRP